MIAVPTFRASLMGRPFSPLDLAPALWLKADAIAGLSDTDPVGTWADSSGNGRDATQATTAKKPTWRTNVLNSYPVVRFDGSDDEIDAATLGLTFVTAFVVAKKAATGTDSHMFDGGNQAYRMYFADSGTNPFVAANGNFKKNTGTTITNFNIYTMGWSGAGPTGYVNGAAFNGSLVGSATGNLSAQTGLFRIGKHSDGSSSALNGDIAEIIVYGSALSAADRQKVETFLNSKYHIY